MMSQPADTPTIACTLGPTDLAAQANRWKELFQQAEVQREVTDEGIRLVFRELAGVESELNSLIEVEVECCAWAEWKVSRADSKIILTVSSTGDGVQTLHEMFNPLAVDSPRPAQ